MDSCHLDDGDDPQRDGPVGGAAHYLPGFWCGSHDGAVADHWFSAGDGRCVSHDGVSVAAFFHAHYVCGGVGLVCHWYGRSWYGVDIPHSAGCPPSAGDWYGSNHSTAHDGHHDHSSTGAPRRNDGADWRGYFCCSGTGTNSVRRYSQRAQLALAVLDGAAPCGVMPGHRHQVHAECLRAARPSAGYYLGAAVGVGVWRAGVRPLGNRHGDQRQHEDATGGAGRGGGVPCLVRAQAADTGQA